MFDCPQKGTTMDCICSKLSDSKNSILDIVDYINLIMLLYRVWILYDLTSKTGNGRLQWRDVNKKKLVLGLRNKHFVR